MQLLRCSLLRCSSVECCCWRGGLAACFVEECVVSCGATIQVTVQVLGTHLSHRVSDQVQHGGAYCCAAMHVDRCGILWCLELPPVWEQSEDEGMQ
jgi:hypothetical protein